MNGYRRRLSKFLGSYLLDGNIFDELLINAELKRLMLKFSHTGRIKFISTHVEKDEIDAIPFEKAEKWVQINLLRDKLRASYVPVSGFLLDRSKLRESKFISHQEMEKLVNSINGNSKYINDSVLALTAKENDAILVTNDAKLLKKAISVIGVRAIDSNTLGEILRNCEI